MVNYNNPFLTTVGGSRSQFNQPQNQYDFSGWGDRLNKIEQGIAGLTKQFNNFQTPGDVAPEYTGNAAPEPLEQPVNETGVESLMAEPAPAPTPMAPQPTSMSDWMGGYEFDLAPTMGTNMNEFMEDWRTENPQQPTQGQGGLFGPQSAYFAWDQANKDFKNTPEYLQWQQRQEERGPLSSATEEAIRGGARYSSIGGSTIDPYIRGGGGGYEDYLSTHEKMAKARPQIEALRQNWQGAQSQDMIDQMNAIYQSVGLGPGGTGGTLMGASGSFRGGGGGQGQALRQQIRYDPTKMMGGENWKPMGQEEYQRQYDLWGSHMDYKQFSKQAREQMGMDSGVWRAPGANPMFGHAFQEWQQFNQGQAGGPYTNPNQSRSQFQNIPLSALDPVRDAEQIASQRPQLFDANRGNQTILNQTLGAGIGALQGPTQQKIKQGLGSFSQGAGI